MPFNKVYTQSNGIATNQWSPHTVLGDTPLLNKERERFLLAKSEGEVKYAIQQQNPINFESNLIK